MRIKLLGVVFAATVLIAGSAGAATLSYVGSLTFQLATLPGVVAPGSGTATVNGSMGGPQLSTIVLGTGGFGPVTASVPVTNNSTINSVIFNGMAIASGTPLVGGAGAPMGLVGSAKICLVFAPCAYASVPVALTPSGTMGSKGLGVGGTQVVAGNVSITMQHNPWTIGQPTVSIHTANSNVTLPATKGQIPAGFVHGPASGTGTTAGPSGVVQLVTVTKTFTSLTGAFPELPIIGVLQMHFVPEPGTLLLLVSGVAGLTILGRKRGR